MTPRAPLAAGLLAGALVSTAATARADDVPPPITPPNPRVAPPPDRSYGAAEIVRFPTLAWTATQLLPSPELALGRVRRIDAAGASRSEVATAFGLRWQATPLLWSWGVHRRGNRFRTLVVDPFARNAGSLELDLKLEYLWGHVDRLLVRPGVRANFPLHQRGEYASLGLGTSVYTYDNVVRVAYDAGLYVLSGTLGAEITIAPAHRPLEAIATLRIRYF